MPAFIKTRRLYMLVTDVITSAIMGLISWYVVFGSPHIQALSNLAVMTFVFIVTMILAKIYHLSIRLSSMEITKRMIALCFLNTAVFTLVYGMAKGFSHPDARWTILFCLSSFCAMTVERFLIRFFSYEHESNEGKPTAVVYGAGELGTAMARLSNSGKFDFHIVGFIDDDPALASQIIVRYPVFGSIESLEKVLKKHVPDFLIMAVTNISGEKIQNAVEIAIKCGCAVKIVPNLFESKGRSDISLREIDYADLLGRSLDNVDRKILEEMFLDKTALVTGAGGSIGSEICHQLTDYGVKRLVLVDIDETELHDLCLRLLDYGAEWSDCIVPVVCDIRNAAKIKKIIEQYKPDFVFHAAAYKHVPLMELYPEEALSTNICGSYNVFQACRAAQIPKVVVISTDKAVNPTNAMGATKRVVEMLASAFDSVSPDTSFCCVRFGNVIGSRGSMLPLFLEQIKNGKPITVTHKDIIRYFMAIPEAVGLVFRAAGIAEGGQVMVLDMGKPVRIYDFAKKLVDKYGDGRTSIRITGLRPGEKLYEELLANKDSTIPTYDSRIFKAKVVREESFTPQYIEELVEKINSRSYGDAKEFLHSIVPEYVLPEKN